MVYRPGLEVVPRGLHLLTPIPGNDAPSQASWDKEPSEQFHVEQGERKGMGETSVGLKKRWWHQKGLWHHGLNSMRDQRGLRDLSLSWAWRPAHSRCSVNACTFR